MAFAKEKGECLCQRCGHWWKTKPISGRFIEPKSCAGCKSKVWNQPRVYAGKYHPDAVMAVKTKPTGRAAANLRPEKIRQEHLEDLQKRLRWAKREHSKLDEQLHDPEHWKWDRDALGYYFKTVSEEIKKLQTEISELQNVTV